MPQGVNYDKRKSERHLLPTTGIVILLTFACCLVIYIIGLHYFLHKHEGETANISGIYIGNIRGSPRTDKVGERQQSTTASLPVESADPAIIAVRTENQLQHNAEFNLEDNFSSADIDDTITAVVECSTSQGNLTIDVRGHWSPLGAVQYLKLVKNKLFENLPFFRVCPRYISIINVFFSLQFELSLNKWN